MKLSGFPEKNATACTARSRSSDSNVPRKSFFTAREILLTGSPFKSSATTAIPSTSSQVRADPGISGAPARSEEHTSELQSRFDLVCRLLLEKKKKRAT